MTDLEGGVTSLWLRVEPDVDLDTLLDGVFLDLAPVVLDATDDALATARGFLAYAEDVELHAAHQPRHPRRRRDRRGRGAGGRRRSPRLRRRCDHGPRPGRLRRPGARALDARRGGATSARSPEAGVSVEDAAALVEFRYAATDEQFPTIAKLRAARRLWARVLELSGVSTGSTTGPEQRQHASPAGR